MYRTALWVAGVAGLAVVTFAAPGDSAEGPKPLSIEEELRKAAPLILKALRQNRCENVGVLKFRAAVGDGELRDDLGSINRSLADRLEVALTLALADNDSLGIIPRASEVVKSANPRATYLTEEGRKKLFEINKTNFRVPWKGAGEEKISPDAFLTGEMRVAKDYRTVRVNVRLFQRKDSGKAVTDVCEFTAANDPRTLTEIGVSFARGTSPVKPEDVLPPDKAADEVVAKADAEAPKPDDPADKLKEKANNALQKLQQSPVKLVILYENKPQPVAPLDTPDGRKPNTLLSVPEPTTGQEVSFRLTNTDKTNTYGVVLRVNGMNTIYGQRQEPLGCTKWILKPGETITVQGLQVSTGERGKRVPFKVASPAESAVNSINYDDNVGTFDFVVYRDVPKQAVVKADPEILSIRGGVMRPSGEPSAIDLKSFKAQLKKAYQPETKSAATPKGLIIHDPKGDGQDSPTVVVDFSPEPVALSSTSIRYYSPK